MSTVVATGSDANTGLFVKSTSALLGFGATINSAGVLTAITGPTLRRVTSNPNGSVSAYGGSLALDVTNGTFYVNTTTAGAAGTVWAEVSQLAGAGSGVTKVFALPAPVDNFADNTNTLQLFTGGQYTVAANTLRAGSTIRVRVYGSMSQAAAQTVTLAFALGSTNLVSQAGLVFANGSSFVAEMNATIRTGATTTVAALSGNTSGSVINTYSAAGAALDVTAVNTLSMGVTFSAAAAGTNMDIGGYEVYIAR